MDAGLCTHKNKSSTKLTGAIIPDLTVNNPLSNQWLKKALMAGAIFGPLFLIASGLLVGRFLWGRKSKVEKAPVSVPPKPLNLDQVAFRTQLKQFCLAYPDKLLNGAAQVQAVLTLKIRVAGGDHISALFQAVNMSSGAERQAVEALKAHASKSVEDIGLPLQEELVKFFIDHYRMRQIFIGNLNRITRIDIQKMPEGQKWMEDDKDAYRELEMLKVLPEGAYLQEIYPANFAFAGHWLKNPQEF